MKRPDGVRHRAAILTAAVPILLTAACTSDNEPTTAPTSPADTPTASTSTPTADATPTSNRSDAVAGAQNAVHDYLALFDEVSNDPDRDAAELKDVAAGRALAWAMHQVTNWRDAGQRGVGKQVASAFTATNVVLDPDPGGKIEHPTVELTACIDVSATDLIDQNGNSLVPASRPDRAFVDYVVINPDWPEDQGWIVTRENAQLTDSDPPEFVPCD